VERTALQLQERLTRRLPEALGAGVPGIGVALLAGPEVVWAAAVGVADAATGAPLTPASVFEGASLSKPVFACAVLRLWEAGVLDLDRPLSDYLPAPYLPDEPRLPLITARHVLAHRTGFPNWRGRGRPLVLGAAPGARFGYSGEGYVYLQRAVEHLVGAPLHEVVAARVLAPLGLAHSSYVWRPGYAQTAARGHRADGVPLDKGRPTAGNAAHSLHTTPTDFARFAGALLAPEAAGLLRGPTVAEMRAPQTRIDDRLAWGLGWGLQRPPAESGEWSLWHWGDNPGYKHVALIGPEHGLVVMTNGDRGLTACRALLRAATGTDAPLFEFLDAFERHVVRVESGEAHREPPTGAAGGDRS
jgi:CubicO group peptidase (beta-lactamase class C family)